MEALLAKRVDERPVAGFNLLAALDGEALLMHWDGRLRTVAVPPGAHVISSDHDLDSPDLPEAAVFSKSFGGLAGTPSREVLQGFLRSHEGSRPVCKHGDQFGTVSSTIFVDGAEGTRLLHAAGPPCRTLHQAPV